MSALLCDNVANRGSHMPWHQRLTLLDYLEERPGRQSVVAKPFRMPVQGVNRANADFRGYAGTVVSGSVRVGDPVAVFPSGRETRVWRVFVGGEDCDAATAEQAVTLTLADEIDISRGDVLAAADAKPAVADQFEATIMWMHDRPMLQGRTYLLKIGARTLTATVAPIKFKINVNTMDHLAARELGRNDIGVCNIELDHPVVFEPYSENRDLGAFILIDRLTNITVGAGLLHFALRRSENVRWQRLDVDKIARAELNGHKPCVLWFTGLSGAGKSTIANILERRLHALGCHTYLLDGDNVRHGLNKDLGFTAADRVENIRRVGEVSRLMVDSGLIVLVALISPFRAERRMARELMGPDEFVEVFVDTPLAVAESRDPKGLYRKVRPGELKNFTGVDSPYEAPDNPEIRIDTRALIPQQAADLLIEHLRKAGIIGSR